MRFDIQSDTPYKVSGLSELPVVNNPPILYANNALPGARLSPQTLQELYKKIKDSKRYLPSDEKHPYNKFRVAKRYNNQKIVEVNSTIIANHHAEVYGPNHRLTLKSQQRAIQARQAIFRIRTSYAIRFGENIESYGTVREKRQFL